MAALLDDLESPLLGPSGEKLSFPPRSIVLLRQPTTVRAVST